MEKAEGRMMWNDCGIQAQLEELFGGAACGVDKTDHWLIECALGVKEDLASRYSSFFWMNVS